MAELATLERLIKERDKLKLYIRLLKSNDERDKQLLLELLEQDEKGLNEAIENK